MKKRIVALLSMALCLCLGAAIFTACGKKETPPTEYTVTYVGGEGATGTAPESEKHEEGEKFTLAANTFTKADNTFAKWSDGTAEYAAGAEYTMPAKDVTFTAVWTATTPGPEGGSGPEGGETPSTTYAVTFVLGEGVTGTAPTVEAKEAGATFALPATTATKTGYTFKAWTDGTTEYAAGAQFTMPASAVTFTAVWVPASIVGKWTAETEIYYSGMTLVDHYEITIIEADASADYDLESVTYHKWIWVEADTAFDIDGDGYAYATWTEDTAHAGVYRSRDVEDLTLTFADHALSGVEEGEGLPRVALDFTFEALGSASLSDGNYWTAFTSGSAYLYEIAVSDDDLSVRVWNAGGGAITEVTTEEAPYAGSWHAIGEYVYATYTIPSTFHPTTEEYLIAADGSELSIVYQDGSSISEIALHKGTTVKHTVTLEGTEEETTLTVWGGLSIGNMSSTFLNAKKTDAGVGDTDWYDGTTRVDYSYVPTADVTLTGTNVAKYPSGVTFSKVGSYAAERITLPDARIKNLMTYSDDDDTWSIELPDPSVFGFAGANAGYVFKGWKIGSETKAVGETYVLSSSFNIFQEQWEFPLEGLWTAAGDKAVMIRSLAELEDPNARVHFDAVARILIWDATAGEAAFGWIEFDGTTKTYTVHGIEGIEEISVAEGELVLEGTHYTSEEIVPTTSLVYGLYTAEGKPGIVFVEAEDEEFYLYEDDTMSEVMLYGTGFGNFHLVMDWTTGEVLYAVCYIEGDPENGDDLDTLGVADFSDGSITEYALPKKINIHFDANGGTGDNEPLQVNAGTPIPDLGSADDPTAPDDGTNKKFLYWALRSGEAGNYTYTEIPADDSDEAVFIFEDITVYAVYGYTVNFEAQDSEKGVYDIDIDPANVAGEEYVIDVDDPTALGVNFLGWTTDPEYNAEENDGSELLHKGDTVSLADCAESGEITLHAVWEKIEYPYSHVKFATDNSPESVEYAGSLADTLISMCHVDPEDYFEKVGSTWMLTLPKEELARALAEYYYGSAITGWKYHDSTGDHDVPDDAFDVTDVEYIYATVAAYPDVKFAMGGPPTGGDDDASMSLADALMSMLYANLDDYLQWVEGKWMLTFPKEEFESWFVSQGAGTVTGWKYGDGSGEDKDVPDEPFEVTEETYIYCIVSGM